MDQIKVGKIIALVLMQACPGESSCPGNHVVQLS